MGFLGKFLQFTEGGGRNMTLREIAKREAAREDMPIYGTADQVADFLADLSEEVGADGFHFRWATKDYPYVVQIASELVPALRRRRLFRSDYSGKTLKDHLFGPQRCEG